LLLIQLSSETNLGSEMFASACLIINIIRLYWQDGGKMTHKENQFNKDYYFIDGWNLPADCELKLEQIAKEDGIDLPESLGQYRIKPAKSYDAQV